MCKYYDITHCSLSNTRRVVEKKGKKPVVSRNERVRVVKSFRVQYYNKTQIYNMFMHRYMMHARVPKEVERTIRETHTRLNLVSV